MILIYCFVLLSKILVIELKIITQKNCEKVSEELLLNFEDKKFDDNFELTKVNSKSRFCLPIDSNSVGNGAELSCCTIQNEIALKSISTDDYLEIIRKLIKINLEKLIYLQTRLFKFQKTVIKIFSNKLKVLIMKSQRYNNNLVQVKQFGDNLFFYINNIEIVQPLEDIVTEFLAILFHASTVNPCQAKSSRDLSNFHNRRTRHWFHSNRRLSQTVLNQWIRSNGSPDLAQTLTKTIDTFISEINMTKSLNNILNVSISILESLYKCQDCFIPNDCSINIFRMSHCSYCAGEVLTVPCFSVCFQIINKCLSGLDLISKLWVKLFEIVENNFQIFSTKYGILMVIQSFHEKLMKIILQIQISNEATQKGKEKCSVNSFFKDMFENTTLFEDTLRNASIYLVNNVYNEVRNQKSMWQNFEGTVCNSAPWFTSLSNTNKCWNGSTSSSYTWHQCTFCETTQKSKKISKTTKNEILNKIIKTMQSIIENCQRNHKSSDRLLKKSLPDSKVDSIENTGDKYNDTNINESNLKDLDQSHYMIISDNEKAIDSDEGSGIYNQLKLVDSNSQPIKKFLTKTLVTSKNGVFYNLDKGVISIFMIVCFGIIL